MTIPKTETKKFLIVYYWDEHVHHIQGPITVQETDELNHDIQTWIRHWLAKGEFHRRSPYCTRVEIYKRILGDLTELEFEKQQDRWVIHYSYNANETFEEAQVRIYGRENLG